MPVNSKANTPTKYLPIDLMNSEKFFARHFEEESWSAWRVFLKALSGLAMSEEEAQLFNRCTGRSYTPALEAAWSIYRELWLACGRGSGKSVMSAFLVLALTIKAIVEKLAANLAPGEKLTVMSISAELRQTRVVLGFIKGFISEIPLLKSRVIRETRNGVELKDGIVVESHTASFRSTRGYSLLGVVLDEIAFFRTDEGGANVDTEIVNALKPGLARVPGSMLIAISSPYSRHGALWKAYSKYFGKPDDRILVWQAESLLMNPTLDKAAIEQAYQDDPEAASAEWGAQFRSDLENFVSREAVEACLVRGRLELPPLTDVSYHGFVDPSGGSSDSMTLGISHDQSGKAVLDLVREVKPPFSPDSVCKEFADVLKSYRCHSVTGDRYAGLWPTERFSTYGTTYRTSEQVKSEIYLSALPLLNSGRCELLDHPRLIAQLLNLERRTSRGGKDSIDHPPNAHDDVANAAMGALLLVAQPKGWIWDDLTKLTRMREEEAKAEPPIGPLVPQRATKKSESCPQCGNENLTCYQDVTGCMQCGWERQPPAPAKTPEPEPSEAELATAQKNASGILWFLKF